MPMSPAIRSLQYAVKQQPQLQLSYLHSTGLVWAAALRKDSKELLGQIENAIECMKKDATIAAMHEQLVRHQAGARLSRGDDLPGHGRTRYAGLRSSPTRGHVRLRGRHASARIRVAL